jgi:hypothetical protein
VGVLRLCLPFGLRGRRTKSTHAFLGEHARSIWVASCEAVLASLAIGFSRNKNLFLLLAEEALLLQKLLPFEVCDVSEVFVPHIGQVLVTAARQFFFRVLDLLVRDVAREENPFFHCVFRTLFLAVGDLDNSDPALLNHDLYILQDSIVAAMQLSIVLDAFVAMVEQELLKLCSVLYRVSAFKRVVAVPVVFNIGVARRLQELLDEVLFFHALENTTSFRAVSDHDGSSSPLVVQL